MYRDVISNIPDITKTLKCTNDHKEEGLLNENRYYDNAEKLLESVNHHYGKYISEEIV